MADQAKVGTEEVLSLVKGLQTQLNEQSAVLADFKTKAAATPNYHGVVGAIPRESEGYSILRATAYSQGLIGADKAKYEVDTALKLKSIYESAGWRPTMARNASSFVVPYCTRHIPRHTSESDRLVGELKLKMVANAGKADPDEAYWIQKKLGGMVTKDIGTISDAAGGVLVGFPTLGELVDMQRNIEAFPNAGAMEVALPPNGRLQYPKLSNSSTGFWVGEGATITESTPATGYLDLQGKKLGVLVDINNELIRFASITTETLVRTDMAKVAALKADLAMLEGTGGTQIKGLITYPSAASWTPGTDPLLAYTVTSNLLQVKDAAEMEALMPDTAGEPTAWIMRRNLWAKLRNRRADAVSAADNAGPYLASITRSLQEKQDLAWDGTKVVRSSQVSNTRGGGSQTYVILGYFPDWVIARFGVVEFLQTNSSDTALTTDITRVRALMTMDAGPRHASSFVFADSITIS